MRRTWKWAVTLMAVGAAALQLRLGGWQTFAMLPILAAVVVLAWLEREFE